MTDTPMNSNDPEKTSVLPVPELKPRKKSFNQRFFEVALICILVIALLFLFAIPALNQAREKARRLSCASNLHAYGLALKQYAMDNNDFFPPCNGAPGLDIIRANSYCGDTKIYVCPSTKTQAAKAGLTEDTLDYVYQGGLSEKDSPDSPIMWDKPNNHHHYGNIFFLDGHVTGYPGANWLGVGKKSGAKK